MQKKKERKKKVFTETEKEPWPLFKIMSLNPVWGYKLWERVFSALAQMFTMKSYLTELTSTYLISTSSSRTTRTGSFLLYSMLNTVADLSKVPKHVPNATLPPASPGLKLKDKTGIKTETVKLKA